MWLPTAALAEHTQRLTYKPGFTLEVRDGRWEGQHFVINGPVPNAYRPDEQTNLDIHSPLPPMRTLSDYERWIGWRLGRVEHHEMREWFKRDGKPIWDPHAPYSERDQ